MKATHIELNSSALYFFKIKRNIRRQNIIWKKPEPIYMFTHSYKLFSAISTVSILFIDIDKKVLIYKQKIDKILTESIWKYESFFEDKQIHKLDIKIKVCLKQKLKYGIMMIYRPTCEKIKKHLFKLSNTILRGKTVVTWPLKILLYKNTTKNPRKVIKNEINY